jgi:hypothetical protein
MFVSLFLGLFIAYDLSINYVQQLQNSRLGLGEKQVEEPPAKKADDRKGMSHGSHMIIGKAHCLKILEGFDSTSFVHWLIFVSTRHKVTI